MEDDNSYLEDNRRRQMGNFDKRHESFRWYEFVKFMNLMERRFINNFRFEGDKEFTRAKQRIFLKMCFRFGYGGIVNTSKVVIQTLDKKFVEILGVLEFDLQKVLNQAMSTKVPVSVFPYMWDVNERVAKATAITAPRHNTGKRTYTVTKADTAILQFDNNHKSGYWWWLIPAYWKSTGATVLKKRLTLLDGKLANDKVNNEYRNVKYDDVYDVNRSFLELSPSQKSITSGKFNELNLTTLLDQKLKRVDMSNGESINDLLLFVEKNEERIMREQGFRTNINEGKQERSISKDFESMEVHWNLLEREQKDQMELFTEDYKRIFGKKITFKTITDETIEKLRQDALDQAGRQGGENVRDNRTQNV